MADSKLSDLTASGNLTGTELFYSDNGSADVKVTATQIKALTLGTANVFTKAQTFQPDSDAQAGTFRRNSAGQTSKVLEIQTEANVFLAGFNAVGALSISNGTLTASNPSLDLSQTWNASGVTFTGLKFNVTDTASAVVSLLLDLQVGGASKFKVDKDGRTYFSASGVDFAGGAGVIYGNSGRLIFNLGGIGSVAIDANSPGGINLAAPRVLGWTSSTSATATLDTFLSRADTATLQLGAAAAAAPVPQTLQVQSVVAGTSNTAGADFTINGSRGTGTGAGGKIIFQTAPAGTTGTAQNAYATALTLNADKSATFSSGVTVGSLTVTSGAGLIYGNASNLVFNLGGVGGVAIYTGGVGGINLGSDRALGWSPNTNAISSPDVLVARDAANTLALRNSTNAQSFRVYNSWTDASNGEWFAVDWKTTSNLALVGPVKNGTGTQRVQRLQYLEDGGAGSTTPSLGTTCPAASATVKSWIKVITSDGTTAYIPCWA